MTSENFAADNPCPEMHTPLCTRLLFEVGAFTSVCERNAAILGFLQIFCLFEPIISTVVDGDLLFLSYNDSRSFSMFSHVSCKNRKTAGAFRLKWKLGYIDLRMNVTMQRYQGKRVYSVNSHVNQIHNNTFSFPLFPAINR